MKINYNFVNRENHIVIWDVCQESAPHTSIK